MSVKEFIRVFRENGTLRAVKTLGRHVLGIDSGLAKALVAEFGGTPSGTFVQGDASATDFPSSHFDYIMSASVFEHLPDPAAVMQEISRILKPGGTVFTVTHVFTSITGSHDPRLFVDIEALPPWAHLDPGKEELVQPNSYLNKFRIADYLDLFDSIWPECKHEITGDQRDRKLALLDDLPEDVRRRFTEQELLSDVIITLWKKPTRSRCPAVSPR